jgi:hypothetical protein
VEQRYQAVLAVIRDGVPVTILRGGPCGCRHRASTNPALPAADERQGGAVQPLAEVGSGPTHAPTTRTAHAPRSSRAGSITTTTIALTWRCQQSSHHGREQRPEEAQLGVRVLECVDVVGFEAALRPRLQTGSGTTTHCVLVRIGNAGPAEVRVRIVVEVTEIGAHRPTADDVSKLVGREAFKILLRGADAARR